MKKIIWIAVILCLLQTSYTFASTSGMSGGQGYIMESPQNKMIYFYRSQEEIDKATMDDIERQLLLMGINPEENTFLLHGVSLRNDIGEYRTRVLSTKIVNVTGYPGNQPSGGIKFSSPQGGSFNYTPDGGPSKSVSVNFGSPYGTTSVSFTLGKRTDEVTSYSLSVPGYIYCKLWVEKKYECKKYVVEKKVYNDVGYEWQEWSGGVSQILISADLSYRAV